MISNDAKILIRRNFLKNAKEHFLLEVFQVAGTTSKSLKLVWSCGERCFTHFARTDGGPEGRRGGDRLGRGAMLASASVKNFKRSFIKAQNDDKMKWNQLTGF